MRFRDETEKTEGNDEKWELSAVGHFREGAVFWVKKLQHTLQKVAS